jgi:hypothetical protein
MRYVNDAEVADNCPMYRLATINSFFKHGNPAAAILGFLGAGRKQFPWLAYCITISISYMICGQAENHPQACRHLGPRPVVEIGANPLPIQAPADGLWNGPVCSNFMGQTTLKRVYHENQKSLKHHYHGPGVAGGGGNRQPRKKNQHALSQLL